MLVNTYKRIRTLVAWSKKSSKQLFKVSSYLFAIFVTLTTFTSAQGTATSIDFELENYYGECDATTLATTGPGSHSPATQRTGMCSMTENLLVAAIGTDSTTPFANAVQTDSLSYATRVGMYGIVNNAMVAMLDAQPTADVYQHLAQEWVPGYEDSAANSVYAQESGYDFILNLGVAPIWEGLRNIAYLAFIVVLVASGFMIMIRKKIGGQVTMTVFNTIPEVIISLILATFSFAIAGFILNIGSILSGVIPGLLGLTASEVVVIDGPLSLIGSFFSGGSSTGSLSGTLGTVIISGLIAGVSAMIASGGTAVLILPAVIAIASFLVALIGLAIIFIVAMASFRVFATVLMAYMSIIMDTLLAPIYMVISALPGKASIRGDWMRKLFKSTLVFPIVTLLIHVGLFIVKNDLDLTFPKGLTGGDLGTSVAPAGVIGLILTRSIVLYLFFLAAEAPKIIDDWIEVKGGKGIAGALQSAAKNGFGKIPLIGGFFG